MKKIYIAGKLNDMATGYLKNVHAMITAANIIRKAGFSVYIPCLDFVSGIVDGEMEYADYFENNMPWLDVCDCLYVLPSYKDSQGTRIEIQRAIELGKPVYYSIDYLISNERDSV